MPTEEQIELKVKEYEKRHVDESDTARYGIIINPHFLLAKIAELELRIEELEKLKQ